MELFLSSACCYSFDFDTIFINIYQWNVNSEDISEITTEEINSVLQEMKNNEAPGIDYITKELLKDGGEEILQTLNTLFNKCLDAGKVASDWKNAITILLYKKGDKQDLNNYRPIANL